MTIYNANLALVKDQRRIKLKSGLNNLALRDVSAQIRPETALLRSLSNAGSISVLEQNFDFDLLTPQKLLEKYVGKRRLPSSRRIRLPVRKPPNRPPCCPPTMAW